MPATPGHMQPGPGTGFPADVDTFKGIHRAWESRLREGWGRPLSPWRPCAPGTGTRLRGPHRETAQTPSSRAGARSAVCWGKEETGVRVGEQNVSCTLVILEEGSAEGHGRPQGIPGHPHKRTRGPHGKPSVRVGSLGSHLRRGPCGDGGQKGQGRSKVRRCQAL